MTYDDDYKTQYEDNISCIKSPACYKVMNIFYVLPRKKYLECNRYKFNHTRHDIFVLYKLC